ncbi:hypothetical protein SDC9_76777 [bioreactor metagenome]|uniref:Uncharacterized protein n=1 Tax=bioreactor metagenome TaxID=1076179 RepID=A0A644YPI5_9ZZZZ
MAKLVLDGKDDYVAAVGEAKQATLELKEAIEATCDSAQRLLDLLDKLKSR